MTSSDEEEFGKGTGRGRDKGKKKVIITSSSEEEREVRRSKKKRMLDNTGTGSKFKPMKVSTPGSRSLVVDSGSSSSEEEEVEDSESEREKEKSTGTSKGKVDRGKGKAVRGKGKGARKVKNFVSRRGMPLRRTYSQADLKQAIEDVKMDKLSLREAAKVYGVPSSTLSDRVSRRGERLGRPTVLSEEEEELLVERIVIMGEWGYPITKKELCLMIQEYLVSTDRVSRFGNKKPGPDFARGFLKRHRARLSIRNSSNLKRSKAAVDSKVVEEFFARFIQD